MIATGCSTKLWSPKSGLVCKFLCLMPLASALVLGCPLLTPHEVSGAVSGDVAAGVTLTLSGPRSLTTTTDGSGRYTFGDLPFGDYLITPALDGYSFAPEIAAVKLRDNDLTQVNFVATSHLPTLSGTIRGSVWSGVDVELSGPTTQHTTTDLAGYYQFIGLRDGDYRISVSRADNVFAPESRMVTVSGASVTEQDFTSTLSCHGRWCWVSPLPTGTPLYSSWGSGPNDVWAVGGGGTIIHWDGVEWSLVDSGTTQLLISIWGSGPNDIWAVGLGGATIHWDGFSWRWTPHSFNSSTEKVWGTGPDDVWAFGPSSWGVLHWSGSEWANTSEVQYVREMWGSSASDIWAIADSAILHWDGTSWTTSHSVDGLLYSLWGFGPDDIWANYRSNTDTGIVLHWDGTSWSSHAPLEYGRIWGATTTDIWLMGTHALFHWNGTTWTESRATGNPCFNYELRGGTGSDDIWVTCQENTAEPKYTLLHWDGLEWTTPHIETSLLTSIWGYADDDTWAFDWSGMQLHWNGHHWSTTTSKPTTQRLSAVWGSGPDDVWLVGMAGTILHWDGTTLSPVNSGTLQNLKLLGGSSPRDAWAIGDQGTLFTWNGSKWSTVDTRPHSFNADKTWGTSSTDLWTWTPPVLGHWSGTEWTSLTPPPWIANSIIDVWAAGPNDIWFILDRTVSRWNGVDDYVSISLDCSIIPTPWTGSCGYYQRIHGLGPDDIWISSLNEGAFHWNGSSWKSFKDNWLLHRTFWIGGWDDMLATIASFPLVDLVRWNGSHWTSVSTLPLDSLGSVAAWANGPNDIWVLEDGVRILHWRQ